MSSSRESNGDAQLTLLYVGRCELILYHPSRAFYETALKNAHYPRAKKNIGGAVVTGIHASRGEQYTLQRELQGICI
jgi:hypothetical protein